MLWWISWKAFSSCFSASTKLWLSGFIVRMLSLLTMNPLKAYIKDSASILLQDAQLCFCKLNLHMSPRIQNSLESWQYILSHYEQPSCGSKFRSCLSHFSLAAMQGASSWNPKKNFSVFRQYVTVLHCQ